MANDRVYGSKLLQGRVALVTGAGKRLGRAIALRLAEEGADVVVHYHGSGDQAQSLATEIKKLGRKAACLQADLRSIPQIKTLIAQTEKQLGQLDILVNSAANFLHSPFNATTEEQWDASLAVNLKAAFFCAQAAAPLLKQKRGVIINLTDLGGIVGWKSYIPHSISKAGVIMLTKCLAKELAPEVRVNAIAPGTITLPGDAPELQSNYIKRAPLQRSGNPSDVTDAVLFLVQSEFITGQVLLLDGGLTL